MVLIYFHDNVQGSDRLMSNSLVNWQSSYRGQNLCFYSSFRGPGRCRRHYFQSQVASSTIHTFIHLLIYSVTHSFFIRPFIHLFSFFFFLIPLTFPLPVIPVYDDMLFISLVPLTHSLSQPLCNHLLTQPVTICFIGIICSSFI